MQSLFVISLPRSFSTQTFQLAARALNLQQPSWVMDGEILNVDRYWHYQGVRFDEGAKFTTPERAPQLISQLHEFLAHVTNPEGYIYKDVIQPFVMAEWRGLEHFRVLKIQRDVAEIAYSMLRNGWFYPQNAASQQLALPRLLRIARHVTPFQYSDRLHRLFRARFEYGVLEGLVRAEYALQTINGVVISYDEIVRDENVLRAALQQLHPETRLEPFAYITPPFIAKRERVARRRAAREVQRLAQKIENLRARLLQKQV